MKIPKLSLHETTTRHDVVPLVLVLLDASYDVLTNEGFGASWYRYINKYCRSSFAMPSPAVCTRSSIDRGGSSHASSESPCRLSPDFMEFDQFIDSYVQEYRVEGWLNDVPNDADPERPPLPVLQEE